MSFFSKIEAFLKKALGSTTWEKTASGVLTVAAPLLETAVQLAAGSAAEAAVAEVVGQVQSDLAAVNAVISSATAAGKVTATSVLGAVQTNLGTLLTSADVKSAAKSSEITTVVSTVISELEAVLKAI